MKRTSTFVIKQMHEPLYHIVHMHLVIVIAWPSCSLLAYNVHIRALLKVTVGINVENEYACWCMYVCNILLRAYKNEWIKDEAFCYSYKSYLHPGNSLKTIVSARDSVSTFFATGLAWASLWDSPSDLHCCNSLISTAGICGDDNLVVLEVSIRDEGSV